MIDLSFFFFHLSFSFSRSLYSVSIDPSLYPFAVFGALAAISYWVMGLSNIRDNLIEFSSSLDYFAICSEDGSLSYYLLLVKDILLYGK